MRSICCLSLLALGCGPSGGDAFPPVDTNVVAFNLHATDMGIHPSQSVLADPNNPFVGISLEELNNGTPDDPALKWRINARAPGSSVAEDDLRIPARFYCWATVLAQAPNGENQFYTAERLGLIYLKSLAAAEQLEAVADMAIAAHTVVLNQFSLEYSRDAGGSVSMGWAFATGSLLQVRLIYQERERRTGQPVPWVLVEGWNLVVDANGSEHAARL
jgi:hypothetical protein